MITNKKIKELVTLNEKAKARKESGLFLVEGIKMFSEVPKERISEIYVSESFLQKEGTEELFKTFRYETVSDDVFKKISDTVSPQGILCVVQQKTYTLNDMIKTNNPLLMVLEDIQDPGNLGTIMRTGEGAGVSGIIMTKGCVDIYNPKTIRSTMGSIYRIPFFYTDEIANTINKLKKEHIKIYAAHLQGKKYYDEISYFEAESNGTAFLIGNEGNGLKEETALLADTYIKIPMEGKVESLNAAIASSILMYEVSRQRRIHTTNR